jgi:arylsulfatase A-like enzyme
MWLQTTQNVRITLPPEGRNKTCQMDRRRFIQMGLATATIAAATDLDAAAPNKKKPNILYVFSDQHRAVSMPGDDVNAIVAPTLDTFRKQNMEMTNCISNNPLCSPYRAILMTGLYSQQNGVSINGTGLSPTQHGLGEHFRQAGYHTGYVGKWHLHKGGDNTFVPAGPDRFGFEDWHTWCNTNAHYVSYTFDEQGQRVQPKGYNATLMTDEMLTFLEKQKSAEKPWFVVLSWNPPHPPYNPPEEDQKPYDHDTLKLRPNTRFITEYIKTKGEHFAGADEASLRRAMQGYYGGITAIDKDFARILQALESNGQDKDTTSSTPAIMVN